MSSREQPRHREASETEPVRRRRGAGGEPAVVLVRPREEGNVGAVARAMANMGLHELILVEPAPRLGGQARGFGVGGWHVLERAVRFPSLAEALAPFHRAVGTTSARGRTLERSRVVEAADLAAELGLGKGSRARVAAAGHLALVFGPEDTGLRSDELALCDPIAVVPCAVERPTLNLSQAVLLVAYELFRAGAVRAADGSRGPAGVGRVDAGRSSGRGEAPPASHEELRGLLDRVAPLVHHLGFDHGHIHRAVVRDLELLLRRASPNLREAGLLRRLVERCRQRLGAADGASGGAHSARRGEPGKRP